MLRPLQPLTRPCRDLHLQRPAADSLIPARRGDLRRSSLHETPTPAAHEPAQTRGAHPSPDGLPERGLAPLPGYTSQASQHTRPHPSLGSATTAHPTSSTGTHRQPSARSPPEERAGFLSPTSQLPTGTVPTIVQPHRPVPDHQLLPDFRVRDPQALQRCVRMPARGTIRHLPRPGLPIHGHALDGLPVPTQHRHRPLTVLCRSRVPDKRVNAPHRDRLQDHRIAPRLDHRMERQLPRALGAHQRPSLHALPGQAQPDAQLPCPPACLQRPFLPRSQARSARRPPTSLRGAYNPTLIPPPLAPIFRWRTSTPSINPSGRGGHPGT